MKLLKEIAGYVLGGVLFVVLLPTIMWWASGMPALEHIGAWRAVITGVLILGGLALSVWTIVYMKRRGKGNPMDAFDHEIGPRTQHLMVDGPYRLNRNPMLTGTFLYLLGYVVWIWTWQALLVWVIFVAIMLVQVLSEEKRLRRDFGEEYEAYCRRTGRFLALLCAVLLLAGCGTGERLLEKRAAELCQYIPDHELLEASRDYMTDDFYAVLDTMFNLPNHEALDHEWLYYFVTGNGGTIADYEVVGVEQTDKDHAVATIRVRQIWEDGSFDPESDIEEHRLYMEHVDSTWLMSDFDEHKADCIRYIANNRYEQALRDVISDYLVREIGPQYAQGEWCIPVVMIAAVEDCETEIAWIWGDFWVYWYNISGDTLKTVSGGNHSGCMLICAGVPLFDVCAFEQTVDGAGNDQSAREIFGSHYDIYQNMHSNQDVREAVRREQLGEYVRRHNLPVRYYQDYGWPAVELF